MMNNSDDNSDNRVGYCRPPRHSRFKAGQSGNPKGRPRGRMSAASILGKLLKETIIVRENGKVFRVTKHEAMMRSLLAQALGGNLKAAQVAIKAAVEILPLDDIPGKVIVRFVDAQPDPDEVRRAWEGQRKIPDQRE